MADNFGASHRQLVKDTNAGNVAQPPKAVTTNLGIQSRTHREYGSEGASKSDLAAGLLAVGADLVGKANQRKKEVDFKEGYARGLESGYEEDQKSPISDMLFGKGATLRGAQKRIVENDGHRWLNTKMQSLEDDMMSYDEDEYQEVLQKDLQSTLEDHDDPEMKADIAAMATKQFETLARNHTQLRKQWIALTNTQAVEDNIAQAVERIESAAKYGDTMSQRESVDAAEQMFDQPLDMEPGPWLEANNNVIIRGLSQGSDTALKVAKEMGIVAMMLPSERAKLGVAQDLFNRKQGREYHRDEAILLGRIQSGAADEDEIDSFQGKYPSQVDANKYRGIKLQRDTELANIAKEQAQATDSFISGNVSFNDFSDTQQAIAVQQTFDGMSVTGLEKIRQDAIQRGTFDGDPTADFTQQQKTDYMLDNPYQYASAAAQHPEVKYPAVQNMATQLMFDMRNESLTLDDVDSVNKKMEFLETFKSQLGNNFQKQFRSTDDAVNYAVYSGLVKDAGFNPVNAMRDIRAIADAPDIEVSQYDERISDSVEDLADDFMDASPQSQGISGIWYGTSEFDTTLTDELRTKMTKYTEMYKGDIGKAQLAAKADIRRNGVVSNGQFIVGGAKVQIKGGSIEDYIRGVNADDNLRSQITNMGLGFAPDADYTSMKVTVDPFTKNGIIIHSVHEETGHPISVALTTPKSGSDFSPYGVNSFTGYNPNIANAGERKKAMVDDSVMIKAHKTVGDAMNKVFNTIME